jgi:hypothetical protein
MLDVDGVRAVHAAMRELAGAGRSAEAVALVERLEGWAADDLNGGALADLWWTFCEALADAVASSARARATRLYDLTIASFQKEGSQATGSGEGMMSVADVKRVEAKRAAR